MSGNIVPFPGRNTPESGLTEYEVHAATLFGCRLLQSGIGAEVISGRSAEGHRWVSVTSAERDGQRVAHIFKAHGRYAVLIGCSRGMTTGRSLHDALARAALVLEQAT